MSRHVTTIVLLVLGFTITAALGVAVGGGTVYLLLRDRGRVPLIARSLKSRLPDFRTGPRAMPSGTVSNQEGALVVFVEDGSPAAAGDLSTGDVLTAVDGQVVASASDLVDAIGAHRPGDEVVLSVTPAGGTASKEIRVTLGAKADDDTAAYLGVRVSDAFSLSICDPSGECHSVAPNLPRMPMNPQDGSGFQFHIRPPQQGDAPQNVPQPSAPNLDDTL